MFHTPQVWHFFFLSTLFPISVSTPVLWQLLLKCGSADGKCWWLALCLAGAWNLALTAVTYSQSMFGPLDPSTRLTGWRKLHSDLYLDTLQHFLPLHMTSCRLMIMFILMDSSLHHHNMNNQWHFRWNCCWSCHSPPHSTTLTPTHTQSHTGRISIGFAQFLTSSSLSSPRLLLKKVSGNWG